MERAKISQGLLDSVLQFIAMQLLAFVWFKDVWLKGSATFLNGGWDQTFQTFSWLSYDWNALQTGSLPLWDFYTSSGQSHIGEMQPAALYPLVWLFSLVATPGDPWWVNVFIIFHFGIALHFMLLLLRGQGMKILQPSPRPAWSAPFRRDISGNRRRPSI